jgi:dephospho-CoA kinase
MGFGGPKMPIICFSGFKGSGKDTCANFLIEKHNAVRVALADPLKDSVSEEYGVDRSSLDDPKRKESPILSLPVDPKDGFSEMIARFMIGEFRTASGQKYQVKGTLDVYSRFNGVLVTPDETLYHTPRSLAILKGSVNRSVMSNYWTQKTFEKAENLLKETPNKLVVVTDVRYRSELAQFKERFGDQVTFVRVNRHEESTSTDPSEMDLADARFDFYIENTSTLENAYAQMECVLNNIKNEQT